jgi:glyoxylase-like metal-dependent hydrolase (beta-lactamase superfamily II)
VIKAAISGFIACIVFVGCMGRTVSGYADSDQRESGRPDSTRATEYSLYALEYGKSGYQSRFVFAGDKSGGEIDFSWLFFVIEYGENVVLIDTGTSDPVAVKEFRIDHIPPVQLLDRIGILPSEVTHVIATHCHVDHMGDVDRYPNAQIFVQRDELTGFLAHPFSKKIADFLRDNPHVTVFDNDYTLFDFITIRKAGGHTRGSSVVYIGAGDTGIVLAGDEFYSMRNIEERILSGTAYDPVANRRFLALLLQSHRRVYLSHDPKIAGADTSGVILLHRGDTP